MCQETVISAFSLGYRHVDTASVYQNQKGVGAALAEMKMERDEFFVTSKIPGGLNASATAAAADACLEELGLKFVDLMLIHFPADFGKNGSAKERQTEWTALENWAKSGKARAIGVSHYCRRQLDDVLKVATVPVAVNQVQYHVGMGTAPTASTDDRDYMRAKGVLYQSFSPLCGPCDPPDNTELLNGTLVTGIGARYNKTGPQAV
ncbi:P100/11E [Symbiodinium sp. CCMP2592]|nr:P100/11E [Symbiodinium sp. CCMP2592]